MKECTDLEVLVMQLKSGEYDGTSIMQACIAIERLIKLEGVCDIAPKWIKLSGIKLNDIEHGAKYVWDVGNYTSLVAVVSDGLISYHDGQHWPFTDNLVGSIYGPISSGEPPA